MTDFEKEITEFTGTARESLRNLEQGQRDQGKRIGSLETSFNAHLVECQTRAKCPPNRNGNGWRIKGSWAGGGICVFEILHRVIEVLVR